jgi:1-pyrroline-5-carboxylate dehydrogenase
MSNAFFTPPIAFNEPVQGFAPGSPERKSLLDTYKAMKKKPMDIPMHIGSDEVRTGKKVKMTSPHDHSLVLGHYHNGGKEHVQSAIKAALKVRKEWAAMPWQDRAAIFLRCAELLAGPFRDRMNAATMLCQSKNVMQAEIDAACEMIDFFRFNVQYMTDIYSQQPESDVAVWNRLEYRGLEGFVFALTPFNFTSICANLCAAPAMMGNVIVWKPADAQIYSAQVIMELFKEAGVPDGVINLVYGDGPEIGEVVFNHPDFAGLHFTGSTSVFKQLWKNIGKNIDKYKSYPRVVGETGGKDFIMVHSSANVDEVATAISRGAFEFQGQKCSAASRVYLPSNIAKAVLDRVVKDVKSFKMGTAEDPSNYINAVIDERAFRKISGYIDFVKKSKDAKILVGGKYDGSKGWFIEPTVVLTEDPKYRTMCEEIFGPVVTVYIYDENDFSKTLDILDKTSEYALTGSIFSKDRAAINLAAQKLEHAAGNFYINDKPTGAVVGQQPFGGARGSGTNDKAGSYINLLRWVSARTIKETLNPAKEYRYPFLG